MPGESFGESAKETSALKAKVDQAFESLALANFSEEYAVQCLMGDVECGDARALLALLEEKISERFGEPYQLSPEGDFALARRARPNISIDFDPRETLAVKWKDKFDLPSGKIDLEYSVFQAPQTTDRWAQQSPVYDEPVLTDQQEQFRVSPETLRKVYDRLEAEHLRKMQKYEKESVAYEALADWVGKNQGKQFDADEWARHELLRSWEPSGPTWEASFVTEPGQEAMRFTFWNDKDLVDVYEIAKPPAPERSYPPMRGVLE